MPVFRLGASQILPDKLWLGRLTFCEIGVTAEYTQAWGLRHISEAMAGVGIVYGVVPDGVVTTEEAEPFDVEATYLVEYHADGVHPPSGWTASFRMADGQLEQDGPFCPTWW
ncbi:MAG: hypothetical protein R3F59_01875 [Myxococcota bacterium]